MSLNCGIVGLPNVGKSTIFQALTSSRAEAANYPFCTIDPNVGIVNVRDKRLTRIAELIKTEKIVPTTVEIVDIAGLVKGASKGEGLGNQFLGNIRNVNAIVHVVRCFDDDDVVHVDGRICPEEDIAVINTELMMADLEAVEKKLVGLPKLIKSQDKEISGKGKKTPARTRKVQRLPRGGDARRPRSRREGGGSRSKPHDRQTDALCVQRGRGCPGPRQRLCRKGQGSRRRSPHRQNMRQTRKRDRRPRRRRREATLFGVRRPRGLGARKPHGRVLRAPRAQDVLYGRTEGGAGVDVQGGLPGTRGGGGSSTRTLNGALSRPRSTTATTSSPIYPKPKFGRRENSVLKARTISYRRATSSTSDLTSNSRLDSYGAFNQSNTQGSFFALWALSLCFIPRYRLPS